MNRIPGALLKAALSVAVAGLAAQAETFYDKDGILFEGTIRLALSNAAVCNVVEENHTEQEYEKRKANQGRPLHAWRVDLSVRNGSGRELDFLRADSRVRSEPPPCDNWDGPPAGALEPFISMTWSGNLEVLSMPYGMHQGQKEGRALYVLAFDGQRPRFGKWDINYTFAKGAGKEPAAGASRTPVTGGAPSTAPADSESQENLFWQSIMNSTTAADFEAYLRQFPNGIFRVLAQNRLAALRAPAASRVESRAPQPPRLAARGRPSGIGSDQTCAGKPRGAACWMELTGQPECYVWDNYLITDLTVTWTGECSGDRAQGEGTLKWVREGGKKIVESTGSITEGKRHGRWVERLAGGHVWEGPYVDGKQHGRWVQRFETGIVEEGSYVDGKQHGRWVVRWADGTNQEGSYVDGKRHGRWVVRWASGGVEETTYVNGRAQRR